MTILPQTSVAGSFALTPDQWGVLNTVQVTIRHYDMAQHVQNSVAEANASALRQELDGLLRLRDGQHAEEVYKLARAIAPAATPTPLPSPYSQDLQTQAQRILGVLHPILSDVFKKKAQDKLQGLLGKGYHST